MKAQVLWGLWALGAASRCRNAETASLVGSLMQPQVGGEADGMLWVLAATSWGAISPWFS